MALNSPVLIVQDDVWLRLIGVVLDPRTSQERVAAFADFMSPDEPNFRTHPVKTAVRSFIGGSANIFYECTSANNREQMLRLILLRHLPS
jgi:hypothetical protein